MRMARTHPGAPIWWPPALPPLCRWSRAWGSLRGSSPTRLQPEHLELRLRSCTYAGMQAAGQVALDAAAAHIHAAEVLVQAAPGRHGTRRSRAAVMCHAAMASVAARSRRMHEVHWRAAAAMHAQMHATGVEPTPRSARRAGTDGGGRGGGQARLRHSDRVHHPHECRSVRLIA